MRTKALLITCEHVMWNVIFKVDLWTHPWTYFLASQGNTRQVCPIDSLFVLEVAQ